MIEWSSELAETITDSSSEEKADRLRVDPVSTSETSKEKLVGISSGIETSAACAIIGASFTGSTTKLNVVVSVR